MNKKSLNSYLKRIKEGFGENEELDKYEYASMYLFDFTTYDGEIDKLFCTKMSEVMAAILSNKTYDYIENEDNYLNYMYMINMPFLVETIDWGTSVRGAWIDLPVGNTFRTQIVGDIWTTKHLEDYWGAIIKFLNN